MRGPHRLFKFALVALTFAVLFAAGIALGGALIEPDPGVEPASEPIAGAVDVDLLGEPHLGELTFDWPRDCSVPVTEHHTGGNGRFDSDIEYRLDLSDEQGDLVMTPRDIRMTHSGGKSVANSPARARLDAGNQFPQFVVDESGTYVESRDVQATLQRMAEADPKFGEPTAQAGYLTLLDQNVRGYWDAWVGRWVEWGAVGKSTLSATRNDDSTFTFSSVGTTPAGSAVLRYVQDLSGASGAGRTTIEVVTDPTTLRPSSAHWETQPATQNRPETTRTTRFDWTASSCEARA